MLEGRERDGLCRLLPTLLCRRDIRVSGYCAHESCVQSGSRFHPVRSNILGGNFSLVGVPSVGASGAIFGTVAVAWIDLLSHWKIVYQPGRRVSERPSQMVILYTNVDFSSCIWS